MLKCADLRRSGRETSGYARLPVIQQSTFTERYPEASGYCWSAHKRRQFSKSSDGDWNKFLNYRGSTLAFFTLFPCASLRYVTDCLIWGPRLLCIPLLVQRALLSTEDVGWSGSAG